MLESAELDVFAASTLALSPARFVSNRLKSGADLGFSVPPKIVSRATWGIDADDLGTRGQDPYQLRVLCTYDTRRISHQGSTRELKIKQHTCFRLVSLCDTGTLVSLFSASDAAVTIVVGGFCSASVLPGSAPAPAALACDVVLGSAGIVVGTLAELSLAGFGRGRFRGLILEV